MPDAEELVQFLKDKEFQSILRRLPIVLKPFNNGEIAKIDVGDLPPVEIKETPKKKSSKKEKSTEEKIEQIGNPVEADTRILKDLRANGTLSALCDAYKNSKYSHAETRQTE